MVCYMFTYFPMMFPLFSYLTILNIYVSYINIYIYIYTYIYICYIKTKKNNIPQDGRLQDLDHRLRLLRSVRRSLGCSHQHQAATLCVEATGPRKYWIYLTWYGIYRNCIGTTWDLYIIYIH